MKLAPSTDFWGSLLLSLAAVVERIQRRSAVSEITLERDKGYGVVLAEAGFFLKRWRLSLCACVALLSEDSTLVRGLR
jgi:hypothetical protein